MKKRAVLEPKTLYVGIDSIKKMIKLVLIDGASWFTYREFSKNRPIN
jgi:hypothetical protein